MLFWAGLRGAVGFALSAGIEGTKAIALQTTVLVAVVLTVILFGGTTAQMLEILGIRTGVQDDEDSSDDEGDDGNHGRGGPRGSVHHLRNVKRRAPYRRDLSRTTSALGHSGKWDDGESRQPLRSGYKSNSSTDDLHTASRSSRSADLTHSSGRVLATAPADVSSFSYHDDDDDEFDQDGGEADGSSSHSGEVLPSLSRRSHDPLTEESSETVPALGALDLEEARRGTRSARQLLDRAGLIMRDGQWFQRIDERYLLPMFSNSVANRKAEERRKDRAVSGAAAAAAALANLTEAAAESELAGLSQQQRQVVFEAEMDADDVADDDEDDSIAVARPLHPSSRQVSGAPSTVRGAFAP